MQVVELSKIRIDGGTQARSAIHEETVTEYSEAMTEGVKLPPLTVFFDGCDYWLADGFHRFYAAKKCDFKSIACDVLTGTRTEAILYAVGANQQHGLRRTNADKRNAVAMLLKIDGWKNKSARMIADKAGVGVELASDVKKQLSDSDSCIGKDGKTRNTSNIGKKKTKPEPQDDIPMDGTPVVTAPDSEPEPLKKDGAGEVIEDKQIVDCFSRWGDILKLCNQLSGVLSSVKKAITDGDPLYGRTNETALKAAIGNARRELTINEPFAICPACGGNRPKTCKVCKGTKYATKPEYERYQAAMKV